MRSSGKLKDYPVHFNYPLYGTPEVKYYPSADAKSCCGFKHTKSVISLRDTDVYETDFGKTEREEPDDTDVNESDSGNKDPYEDEDSDIT